MLQTALTALIVLACAGYASWTLMPAAWRRTLHRRLLRREPVADAGGCGGCGGGCAAPAAPGGATPITIHRRAPR
ncbi:MAG: hypothetical protein CFE45_32305 [Burkholderiales bacterium PBB5]|nr:MAG: hypothetical protein CFE45_32305 [Burkholderiales bacterium PBB5]